MITGLQNNSLFKSDVGFMTLPDILDLGYLSYSVQTSPSRYTHLTHFVQVYHRDRKANTGLDKATSLRIDLVNSDTDQSNLFNNSRVNRVNEIGTITYRLF